MSSKVNYLSVNWEDGMKINKQHFIQQDNALLEQISTTAASFLHARNYGLLPLLGESDSAIKTVIKVDNQEFLRVKVFSCRAITVGGVRIEIPEEQQLPELSVNITNEIEAAKSGEDEDYYILLSIDIFKRQAFGELDANEEPPRYPYTIPGFKVNIISENQIAKKEIHPYSIFIGKMNINREKPEVYDDYIPPCKAVSSHAELISFFNSVEKFYSKMELNLLSIVRKIKEKDQDSTLALSVLYLSQRLLEYITRNHLKLRWEIPDKAPVSLFEYIATSGRVIRNSIDSISASHKEELLNYFTNWSELKQGEFEKLLVYCINFEYHHSDILISIEQFSEFIQIIETLFDKLESLAYIGKKKETNIFVKEQKTKKRSFLAD